MKKKKKEKTGFSLLLQWAAENKYYLYASIVFAFIASMLGIIPYFIFYRVIEAVVNGNCTWDYALINAIAAAVSIALRAFLSMQSSVLSHKGAYRTLFTVRCMVTEHMAKMPLGALNERSTGEIKTVMNESVEKLELFLAHNLPELVMYLSGPIVIFIFLCTINVLLAVVSLIPLVIVAVIMLRMFKKMSRYMGDSNKTQADMNSTVIEYISGMRLIKAYNMGTKSFKKYSDAIESFHRLWCAISKATGPLYAAYIVILECGQLFLIPLGGYLFVRGQITAGILLLFAFIGTQYLTDIRALQELGTNLAYVMNGVKQVKEILDTPIFSKGESFPEKYDIELCKVGFSYGDGREILHDCNLHIGDGERVAFIGESGAGKSTLVQLISRFYDVTSGEILIGGVNIKNIDYETLLEHVSVVFQKSFLTSGTVFENIVMGNSEVSLNEVRSAARAACIDDLIMSLPEGYNTIVGGHEARFSGGERQRICIARAILKNAPILILDEATSAADPENQVEIDEAIENLCRGKTVIIVAHRLGVAQSCDRIAVVENGTLSHAGTWDEILTENSYFKKVWNDYRTARNMSYSLCGGDK